MKKTFACAIRPNKAPSMRHGLSIISLEHSYGLNGSRIFDPTQLAPLSSELELEVEAPSASAQQYNYSRGRVIETGYSMSSLNLCHEEEPV